MIYIRDLMCMYQEISYKSVDPPHHVGLMWQHWHDPACAASLHDLTGAITKSGQ